MLLNQVFCLYWEVLFLIRNQQVPLGTTMHPDSRLMVMVVEEEEEEQSLKRYMASGSLCPIGLHLVNGRRDGAAAPVGANVLW